MTEEYFGLSQSLFKHAINNIVKIEPTSLVELQLVPDMKFDTNKVAQKFSVIVLSHEP